MTASQLAALKAELTNDPLARGYSGMEDVDAAESLNAPNRSPNRESVTGGMLAASVVLAELTALSAANQTQVRALFAAGEMPLTQNLRQQLAGFFGAATTTRANLLALMQRDGSRAEELGLGRVTPSDVADARRLP